MIEIAWSPALLVIAGAVLLPLLRNGARVIVMFVFPALALVLVWVAVPGETAGGDFLGYHLQQFQPTALGRLFATMFIVALLLANLFAFRQARASELTAASVYAGSAVGVTLAGDFLSLFFFWEAMAIAASAVIFSAGTHTARHAAFRYLLVHVFGGTFLLCGILGVAAEHGDLALRLLRANDVYTWMMLLGILINAGAPPFSAWIADAYPKASPFGTVYLSIFTTKSAVFTLLTVFPGEAVLIPFGVYMIFYSIVYALNENDIRGTLAYSIVNPVGFMLVGIGIGIPLTLNGAVAHAAVHIMYKSLLLMSAGSVLFMTGKQRFTELGGLRHSMRLTAVCTVIGALSISGLPLTSAFISKPMIIDGVLAQGAVWLWFVLLAAAVGVFLTAGMKFSWFVFFQNDSGLRAADPPWNMRLAMLALSAGCLLMGLFPHWLYALLPWPSDYEAYTASHVVTQTQLLVFSAIAFFMLLPLLRHSRTVSLDFDWLYRKGGVRVYGWLQEKLAASRRLPLLLVLPLKRASLHLSAWLGPVDAPVKVLQTGVTIGWMVALLALFLLLYYL